MDKFLDKLIGLIILMLVFTCLVAFLTSLKMDVGAAVFAAAIVETLGLAWLFS